MSYKIIFKINHFQQIQFVYYEGIRVNSFSKVTNIEKSQNHQASD